MKKNKKQFILQRPQRLLWAMVLCFTAPLTSAQLSSNIDISENKTLVPSEIALRELMQLLDEETELATRTRMNVDFVPDVMTVLHGGDLEARGVQTVHDALGLVPGIELSRTNDGRPQVLVRGLGPSFFSGKIKFLLNDTPFNGALGGASTLLILPIEQVDRIEVIRGPGSAIYGEYASVGVVNVITRKARAEAYLRSTDLERRTLGASVSHEFHPRLKFDFSFSDVNVAGGDIEVDNDIMRDTPISNAPGPINNREEHQSYLFNAYAGDYHFAWQSVAEGLGDFFGVNNALPSPGQRVVSILRTQSFELSRPWRVGNNWDANAKLGYFQFSLETSPRELFPPGFNGGFPEGVLGAPNYEDDKWYITSEFMYHTIDRHELLFGIDLSYLEQGETYVLRNYDPITLAPNGNPPVLEKFTGDDNWLKEGLERRVIGIYVQDQFTFTDKLKLTAGLRFDDYDDVGSDITPRFAAVYQLSDQKTFKLQYAQSFRPPTFPEMYSQNNPVLIGNEMLQSEHLETLEFGYVHNDGVTVFRLNLFRYNLTDLIQVDGGTGQYENQGEINANGLELEYLRQIERRVKLDANLSYMISEDAETHNRIPGVASVLGNFAILYEPWPNYVFSWQFRHVSYRQREPQDPRLDLNDYSVSDITANIFNLGVKGLSLRLGARNLLDADVLYPAPLVGDPPLPAYLNDYPQTGREIFFQVKYTHH